MERRAFRAMGTEVEVLLEAEPGRERRALGRVEPEFGRLEALLSRFRPDSELVPAERRGALEAGDELPRWSGSRSTRASGRAAGSTRPFTMRSSPRATTGRSSRARRRGRAPVRAAGGGVRLRGRRIGWSPASGSTWAGSRKGYAVDRAVAAARAHGPCLVNAGGDLAVHGRPATGHWAVGLETPAGPLTLGLVEGALATSGRDRRRWQAGGEERHHLIDPATGGPSATDLLTVTVVGRTAVEAEVRAKALFLAGGTRQRRSRPRRPASRRCS